MNSNQGMFSFDSETRPEAVAEAVESLATEGGVEERGAVFTKTEVVEFILDLAGYTTDAPLHQMRILEPSFGGGDFLVPVVDRLVESWRGSGVSFETLMDSLRAVELHRESVEGTRDSLSRHLQVKGFTSAQTRKLLGAWILQDDFLLVPLDRAPFDFVVGNPPYVRQENIPNALLREYRRRFRTMYDRADLYVPFFERSLELLSPGGRVGFICSDRWMKNKYGGPLRRLIHEGYRLRVHVDMVGTDAFLSEVSAYPAITILEKTEGGPTSIARRPTIEGEHLRRLAGKLNSGKGVESISGVTAGADPWLVDSPSALRVLRKIEEGFPTLEQSNCRVGIGVATGADKEFIGRFEDMDVEDSRKLPLVQSRDLKDGGVEWRGNGVLNPFAEEGGLVDLANYPRLKRFLEERKERIANRHCAKKNPARWYRTIDKIDPTLTTRPKLLIPDIKGSAAVSYEPGKLYPHHNLYYVISTEWDLRAVQAILLSSVTLMFIAAYSTRMRGGFLRFQAQYLRRLRLPSWGEVPADLRKALGAAGRTGDRNSCDEVAFRLYGLSKKDAESVLETVAYEPYS